MRPGLAGAGLDNWLNLGYNYGRNIRRSDWPRAKSYLIALRQKRPF